ncbi:MAG: hypothetical protein U1E56_08910 [Bauldia sp.]
MSKVSRGETKKRRVALFTSVPPRLVRLDGAGVDIGAAYLGECIGSWQSAGFDPFSINAVGEPTSHSLRQIRVDRDARDIAAGRPMVFLDDFLGAIASAAGGSAYAIANADVTILDADLAERVASIRPGEVLFSRRLDWPAEDRARRTVAIHGFDFFAGHSDDLRSFGGSGLVFGLPWWDHFFPLAMWINGVRLRQLAPVVAHLDHGERWDSASWHQLGTRFVEAMEARRPPAAYASVLDAAMGRHTGAARHLLLRAFAKLRGRHEARDATQVLNRVSGANIAFIDGVAPIEAAPAPAMERSRFDTRLSR